MRLPFDPRCIDPGERRQANARRKSGIIPRQSSAPKKPFLYHGYNSGNYIFDK
jgi:hypothetical protein